MCIGQWQWRTVKNKTDWERDCKWGSQSSLNFSLQYQCWQNKKPTPFMFGCLTANTEETENMALSLVCATSDYSIHFWGRYTGTLNQSIKNNMTVKVNIIIQLYQFPLEHDFFVCWQFFTHIKTCNNNNNKQCTKQSKYTPIFYWL